MATIWQALEHLDSLSAVASTWRGLAGEQFSLFQKSFLQPEPESAFSISCPEHCGCAHEIVEHRNGRLVAVCRCDPWNCDDFTVTAADIVVWRLNQPKFRRELSHAFGCEAMDADLGIRRTHQIGTFGHARVPVVLTILRDRPEFVSMVRQLVGLLRERFILLAPTPRHLDGGTQAVLRNAGAAFFDLESNIEVLPSGQLRARKSGGELFASLLPPDDSDDVARGLFALVKQLHTEGRWRKAPILQVFRLYCLEGLTAQQVARRCGCAKSLVVLRLQALRDKLGRNPAELRQLSGHFEKIADSLSDSRARRVDRQSAIDEDAMWRED